MTTHIHEDDLVLHYYGETADADERRITSHLADCDTCSESYRRLQRVLTAVEAGASAEPPAGLERTIWARLEPNLAGRRHDGWRSWMLLSPAHLALAATVVLLVTGAFFAGRLVPRGGGTAPPPAAAEGAVRERILLVDLGDHLDRTQMVLVELVAAGEDRAVALSGERNRAEELVAANRLYRQTALDSGEPRIAQLLDEVERVLVEVAAGPDQMGALDLDLVRRRIESKGLLFKVRVVSSEVRERQKVARVNRS